ncbi:hypothetical protein CNECB9_470009 [Cupriavidus necator]|uniref:Uncharacterized protein n=1 Tax=Cupriavidus necator TaxID=106590 RepID=A0A1K0IZ30_CUPNE|nr:hypothetical protein CNECB9_470009 [Cupriavidus necator]
MPQPATLGERAATPAIVRASALKSSFSITPVTPHIGAEIGNIDLSHCPDDDTCASRWR